MQNFHYFIILPLKTNHLNPKLMQKTVVALLLIATCSLFSTPLLSQSIKPPALSPLPGDVKKLVDDYPNHFANILGDEIAKNPQTTDYNCSVKITGAEKSIITLYSSASGSSCGWQGEMLSTEDFEEAKKKYKSLYNQLNNLSTDEGFLFHGKYDEPAEEKKFAGCVLSPNKTVYGFTKLRLEISLQYELLQWKVRVLLYDKEREDKERGKTVE